MSALPSELRSNFCHTKGLDDTRMTPESFPLTEISGKEKDKTRKTRRKEEIWGTDAKRVNCSTLPCSYDNTHKESTWLECLEKRVDISEILA